MIAGNLDPYNVINFIESFLSRSTQESGLSHKKQEEKRENLKAGIKRKQKETKIESDSC